MNFEKLKQKYLNRCQYDCGTCKIRFWIPNSKISDPKLCKWCNNPCVILPLERQIGYGWFECMCGMKYSDYTRGDVSVKCIVCKKDNFPSFIGPTIRGVGKHCCSECRVDRKCPLVLQASKNKYDPVITNKKANLESDVVEDA